MTSRTSAESKGSFFSFLKTVSPFGKTKTHDFRTYQKDVDYSVDFADFNSIAHVITSINVKVGEHIILTNDREQALEYRAETIDFYWNGDSLREIRLKRIFG